MNRHAKPLIDVNEVISAKPTSASLPTPSDAAFTQGPTLLSAAKTTAALHGSSPLASQLADDDGKPLTRNVPPLTVVSSPSSPAKEMKELVDESSIFFVPTTAPVSQERESSPEHQKRDPLSDRLTRAIKKSLTNPTNGPTPSPAVTASKPLEGPTSRLLIATSPESPQTRQPYQAARITLPRSPPPIIQPSKDEYSPPDEDLAKLLGSVGLKLISRAGEPDEASSSSECSSEEKQKDEDRIAPIPIKQRTPPPAFAVTSRPALPKQLEQNFKSSISEVTNSLEQAQRQAPPGARSSGHPIVRQRSSTMVPSASSSSFPSTNPPSTRNSKISSHLTSPSATDVSTKSTSSNGVPPNGADRVTSVRSALSPKPTMITGVPLSSQMPRQVKSSDRRFAAVRGNSPSSSTGDSSSGRAPHTPRDSAEMSVGEDQGRKRVLSTTVNEEWRRDAPKRQNVQTKRRSVSFEDDIRVLNTRPSKSHMREAATAGSDAIGTSGKHVREGARAGPLRDLTVEEETGKEERRKERRRQEAQAAIEV